MAEMDYTPEQLRAMADAMESGGDIRHVEVDGIGVDVDMRVVGDIRTLRLVGKAGKDGSEGFFATVELFDTVLGDQVERVERALADGSGNVPAAKYLAFCERVFEAVGAKN